MKFDRENFKYLTVLVDGCGWSHNTGCQYPLNCPKGTVVEFVSVLHNYYGTWYRVNYNGECCYILPEYTEGNVIVTTESYGHYDVVSCTEIITVVHTDRYGKRYILKYRINDDGKKELIDEYEE